ncbi:MAG TPA: MFS transporter [Sulfuricaulis sp.]|nr:MFS transporter [Sulfuricaulis sp.]
MKNALPGETPLHLPRTVIVIGFVSLLNDFASEMVVPLIPLLLATVLAAGPVALGLIEGVADTVSNLLKLWAGRHSDLYGHRRKPYVVFGYLLSNLARPLIGLSGSWLTVLSIRVTDRIGKGVRTAPRDALISDAIDGGIAGRALFGELTAVSVQLAQAVVPVLAKQRERPKSFQRARLAGQPHQSDDAAFGRRGGREVPAHLAECIGQADEKVLCLRAIQRLQQAH